MSVAVCLGLQKYKSVLCLFSYDNIEAIVKGQWLWIGCLSQLSETNFFESQLVGIYMQTNTRILYTFPRKYSDPCFVYTNLSVVFALQSFRKYFVCDTLHAQCEV